MTQLLVKGIDVLKFILIRLYSSRNTLYLRHPSSAHPDDLDEASSPEVGAAHDPQGQRDIKRCVYNILASS